MKYLITSLLFLYSFSIQAQQISTAPSLPFIEVTGTAEKEVMPDEIYIGFRITAKLFSGIESQENKLKKEVVKIGIPVTNLYITAATSEIIRRKARKVALDESRDYEIKVSNVTELTAVYDAFSNVGIEEAHIAKVNHSMIDSLRKEVRVAAIKVAKDKAVYLLAAVGEKPGKPLEIKEEASTPYFFGRSYLSNTSLTSNTTAPQDDLNYDRLLIKFSYTVKYSIQ